MRQTGLVNAAANTAWSIGFAFPTSPTTRPVLRQFGGMWATDSGNSEFLGLGTDLPNISAGLFIVSDGASFAAEFESVSENTRVNAPYDIWYTYTKS